MYHVSELHAFDCYCSFYFYWWNQDVKLKKETQVYLFMHWKSIGHIFQLIVPVCDKSVHECFALWNHLRVHMTTENKLDGEELKLLCEALKKNRKLNGLYLRSMDEQQ